MCGGISRRRGFGVVEGERMFGLLFGGGWGEMI
jgi:hypothetical protein